MARLFPVCALMMAVCTFGRVSTTLDPGEQAKVMTSVDVASMGFDTLNKVFTEQAAALKDLKKAGDAVAIKKYTKLLKIASGLGNALKMLNAAGAIASFIFTFFMPSDLEVITKLINKRFKEVNSKLDLLDEKLDEIEKSLKANTAFNVFLSDFIKYKNALESGAKVLKDARKAMGDATEKKAKVKLAYEYVKYYEDNGLEGNIHGLYVMAAKPDDKFHRNILDRFIEEKGCDVTMLCILMQKIKRLMTSAGIQKISYYHFKGDATRAHGVFLEIKKHMFEIRRAFQYRVWKCQRDVKVYARKDVEKLVKKPNIKDVAPETIVNSVYEKLTNSYPLYTWAVAVSFKKDIFKPGQLPQWKGETFFTVDVDDKRQLAVVLEDGKVQIGCSDIKNAKTMLIFECDGCSEDVVKAGKNFLTSKRCGDDILGKVVKQDVLSFRRAIRGRRVYYIASTVSSDTNDCQGSQRCNGRGVCKSIPYTQDVQCICYDDYSGAACTKRYWFDKTMQKTLASLRRQFGIATGVPDIVDVHFGINSLSKNLKVMLNKIQTSFIHTQNIIKHSDIIYKVENIVDMYKQLQDGTLVFDEFGRKLDKYLETATPFELQNRLKKMILGQGALDKPGGDMFNTYKRDYVNKYPGSECSTVYNSDVSSLKKSLLYLDLVLGEALVLHKKWLLETRATNDQLKKKYIVEAEKLKKMFEPRAKMFIDYWKLHSCGALKIGGTGVDCKEQLTFSGMTIRPVCNHQREARPGTVSCQGQANSQLKWSSRPACKYVWQPFSPGWGSCTKSCGGGTQRRYRTCRGTSDVNQCRRDSGGLEYKQQSCNTKDCCHRDYDKYKCPNNKCVSRSWLCDGDDDCGDGDDESNHNCNNALRSGDTIALKNHKTGRWLSGMPNRLMVGMRMFSLEDCPGSSFDSREWKNCAAEVFKIFLVHRPKGRIIKHGDTVAFHYSRKKWLSCTKDKGCTRTTCPGYEWQAWEKKNCDDEQFLIYSRPRRGKYVKRDDSVFIKFAGERLWVQGAQYYMVVGGDCSGYPLRHDASSKCRREYWKISTKP